MYQRSQKVIRQLNKIPAQENASMNLIAKGDDSADEFIDRQKFKIEAATKEKTIGKAH